MKQYKKNYELKNAAKDKLDGKYGAAVMVCLLSFLIINGATNLVDYYMPAAVLSTGPSIPAYIARGVASLFLNWILGVFNLGITLFFLNAACDRPYNSSNLFYGFKNDFSKALSISAVFTLVNAVCLLPFQYLLEAYLYTRSQTLLTATVVALAVGAGIYVPISLGISLSYYLMLDFPDKTAKELLTLSLRIMRGHKRRLFYLECSFVPLILLCVCTLFIGFLWLIPYMNMTYAFFFLDIMNPTKTA